MLSCVMNSVSFLVTALSAVLIVFDILNIVMSKYYYRQVCCPQGNKPAGIAFTQLSKNGFFAPQGRHSAPIKVKFNTGSHLRAKFHLYRGRNAGIQPQNCPNLDFCQQIRASGATRLHNYATFSAFLYEFTGSF